MATQKFAPGQLVSLRIATGAQSAQIGFDGMHPQPAFIENVPGRRGVETYAKLPCPNLRPGSHTARAYTDGGVVELNFQVV